MNFLSSETAASEAVGHAILLGITVIGVSMILLYGVPALPDRRVHRFSIREIFYPLRDIALYIGEILYPLREIVHPRGEISLSIGEIALYTVEILCPIGDIVLYTGKIVHPRPDNIDVYILNIQLVSSHHGGKIYE